jgi:Na+-translocating ferredoxin:NAD+ oxidoreductase RnfG subunit
MGPMRRRAMGRRVVRTMATTAVVAGTAGAVHHHQNQKYAQQDAAAQQQQYDQQMQQQQYDQQMQQQAAPAGNSFDEQLVQIQKLSAMKDQGLITEAEFNAKKAQILGI